jgi:hypothetical protein
MNSPSLFILSLPRSLSTLVYNVSSSAVGLKTPSWTSDGEILNVDRFAFLPKAQSDLGTKFLLEQRDVKKFRAISDFLTQCVSTKNFAYKDVIHPFLVAKWLKKRNFKVLKIRRDIAEVADAMLKQGWLYPANIFPNFDQTADSFIRALALAWKELDEVPGVTVNYQDLIENEEALSKALAKLYPESFIPPIHYIDDQFKKRKAKTLARRNTSHFKVLSSFADFHCRNPVE